MTYCISSLTVKYAVETPSPKRKKRSAKRQGGTISHLPYSDKIPADNIPVDKFPDDKIPEDIIPARQNAEDIIPEITTKPRNGDKTTEMATNSQCDKIQEEKTRKY